MTIGPGAGRVISSVSGEFFNVAAVVMGKALIEHPIPKLLCSKCVFFVFFSTASKTKGIPAVDGLKSVLAFVNEDTGQLEQTATFLSFDLWQPKVATFPGKPRALLIEVVAQKEQFVLVQDDTFGDVVVAAKAVASL